MGTPAGADRDTARVLVIGVGNPYRRDDAAGRAAVRRLRERVPASITVEEHDGEGVGLMDAWQGADVVILVDAIASGGAPGTVYRFEAHTAPLPAVFARDSTHAIGVPEAVELARALGRLPARVIVYGIEGRDFTAGEGLSPDVERAVPEIVARVLGETGVPGDQGQGSADA